jgi:hypothetical protein
MTVTNAVGYADCAINFSSGFKPSLKLTADYTTNVTAPGSYAISVADFYTAGSFDSCGCWGTNGGCPYYTFNNNNIITGPTTRGVSGLFYVFAQNQWGTTDKKRMGKSRVEGCLMDGCGQ